MSPMARECIQELHRLTWTMRVNAYIHGKCIRVGNMTFELIFTFGLPFLHNKSDIECRVMLLMTNIQVEAYSQLLKLSRNFLWIKKRAWGCWTTIAVRLMCQFIMKHDEVFLHINHFAEIVMPPYRGELCCYG